MATVRPDNTPQSNVMWFSWDGELLRFTHTSTRQKYHNLQRNPAVAVSIAEPANNYRYLEVRGVVESMEPDDDRASFYLSLQARYGEVYGASDAAVRVVIAMRPTAFIAHG
jgi:PPOX class probable F420-dependent enzyme